MRGNDKVVNIIRALIDKFVIFQEYWKMVEQTCNWCGQKFQSFCLLDNFCSNECNINYWKNSKRLEISSECPQCHPS
jgi:hypothetical protein